MESVLKRSAGKAGTRHAVKEERRRLCVTKARSIFDQAVHDDEWTAEFRELEVRLPDDLCTPQPDTLGVDWPIAAQSQAQRVDDFGADGAVVVQIGAEILILGRSMDVTEDAYLARRGSVDKLLLRYGWLQVFGHNKP